MIASGSSLLRSALRAASSSAPARLYLPLLASRRARADSRRAIDQVVFGRSVEAGFLKSAPRRRRRERGVP